MLGIGIEDYGIIEGEQGIGIRNLNNDKISSAIMWYEVIDLLPMEHAAESMAVYTSKYFRETPAVTRRAYGKGCGVYIGTILDKEGLTSILDQIVSEAGITPTLFGLPEGVEAVVRVGTDDTGRKILFVINHTEEAVTINLDTAYTDALTDKTVRGSVALNSQDVMVLYVQQ